MESHAAVLASPLLHGGEERLTKPPGEPPAAPGLLRLAHVGTVDTLFQQQLLVHSFTEYPPCMHTTLVRQQPVSSLVTDEQEGLYTPNSNLHAWRKQG